MNIESYNFGCIVVNGETYTTDLIIFPDHVQANWWRRKGHQLCLEDLATVLEAAPEVLVVGRGKWGRMLVLPETERLLQERSIRLITLETEAACRSYNQLCEGGTRVVAALHLTC